MQKWRRWQRPIGVKLGAHAGKPIGPVSLADANRFQALHRHPDSGCWRWRGTRDRRGYGSFNLTGSKGHRAHRVAYAIAHGSCPANLVVMHLCHNPNCVRPSHLQVGTQGENMRARKEAWSPQSLRRWRRARGWTQAQAAAWFGVSRSAWTHWESGRYPIGNPLRNRLNAAS